jgi:hypothetical protein
VGEKICDFPVKSRLSLKIIFLAVKCNNDFTVELMTFKGPKLEIFVAEFFTQSKPVGTRK